MATSHYHQIPLIMNYVEMIRPASMLDIGAGCGKWGFLLRDRLELLEGRYKKNSWQTRIYGIEIFEGYRNPIWEYCYDRLWVGDALKVLKEVPKVDLILLPDVIEHLPKHAGRQLLALLEEKGRYLLITTPSFFFKGEPDDNPASEHLSFWDRQDFQGKWFITEKLGSTRLFLIDFKQKGKRSISVEPAEKNKILELLRAITYKIFHKLKIRTGSIISPPVLRKLLSNNRNQLTNEL